MCCMWSASTDFYMSLLNQKYLLALERSFALSQRKRFQTFLTSSLPSSFCTIHYQKFCLAGVFNMLWSCANSLFSKWTKRRKTKRKRRVGTNFSSSWTLVTIDVMWRWVIGYQIRIATCDLFWVCHETCTEWEKGFKRIWVLFNLASLDFVEFATIVFVVDRTDLLYACMSWRSYPYAIH